MDEALQEDVKEPLQIQSFDSDDGSPRELNEYGDYGNYGDTEYGSNDMFGYGDNGEPLTEEQFCLTFGYDYGDYCVLRKHN